MEQWIIVLIISIILVVLLVLVIAYQSNNKSVMEPIQENSFPFKVFVINLNRKPERYKYICDQLEGFGINNYERWMATDGFKSSDDEILKIGITQELINKGRGLAGCAASHMNLWKHIADNNLDWTLILEDDAHFHPEFMKLFHQYWKKTPKCAKVIFPGWCAPVEGLPHNPIIESSCMCLHGYMVNGESARFLLENLPKMTEPIDIIITEYFRFRKGSIMFNGNMLMDGIRPNDYKENKGRCCMFSGIIYQNHQEQGSTIHCEKTVF